MKKANLYWNCSSEIFSYSHKIDSEVLKDWNENIGKKLDSPILFHYKDQNVFIFHFYLPKSIPIEKIEVKANMLAISMMVAFNLAEPGSHIWWLPSVSAPKVNVELKTPKIGLIPQHKLFGDRGHQNLNLTANSIRNAELLWTVLVHLRSHFYFHYIKGMNLLSTYSPDSDYYEEIFLNFWKCLERFISVEFFKNEKKVELKEINKAMEEVYPSDFWKKVKDEVKSLYRLRGSTVAHSYGKETKTTYDDAMKVKILVDFFIHKVLKERVDKKLAKFVGEKKVPAPKL